MRHKPPKPTLEARIAKRYHRLHEPIVDLLQALQDAIPQNMQLGDKVTLTQLDGFIEIDHRSRPVELVINDGRQIFSLKIKPIPKTRRKK